jgi:hypothetical protein
VATRRRESTANGLWKKQDLWKRGRAGNRGQPPVRDAVLFCSCIHSLPR